MRIAPILIVLLSACASFPQLEGTISDTARDAPFPPLTPIPIAPEARGAEAADLQARIAALQAKAAEIRQIDLAALQ
jgi:hypothetical protein